MVLLLILAVFGYLTIGYFVTRFISWMEKEYTDFHSLGDSDATPILLLINIGWPVFLVLLGGIFVFYPIVNFIKDLDIYRIKK
jgi:hypothetical protein